MEWRSEHGAIPEATIRLLDDVASGGTPAGATVFRHSRWKSVCSGLLCLAFGLLVTIGVVISEEGLSDGKHWFFLIVGVLALLASVPFLKDGRFLPQVFILITPELIANAAKDGAVELYPANDIARMEAQGTRVVHMVIRTKDGQDHLLSSPTSLDGDPNVWLAAAKNTVRL